MFFSPSSYHKINVYGCACMCNAVGERDLACFFILRNFSVQDRKQQKKTDIQQFSCTA